VTSAQLNTARALRLAKRSWLVIGNMALDNRGVPVEIVAIRGGTVHVRRASDGGDRRDVHFATLREVAR
jgi:hypothetical protein